MKRRRHMRRAGRVGGAAFVAVVLCATVAVAWTIGTTNPGNSISASTLGSPGTPTTSRVPTTGASCTSITVSWNAAANADRYRVEVDSSGSWTTLAASHATTSYTDTTGYTNRAVTYRITPLLSTAANWTGPSGTVEIACGIGDIDDLALTNPCSSTTLAWSYPPGAANVDIERRVNAGTWTTVASNQSGTTYTDATVHADGATVEYRVRAGSGTTNGNYSNVPSVTDWTAFRVDSITVANSSTLGTLNAGDTITVTFTKPALTSTVTKTTIRTVSTGGTRGLWLPATAASAASTDVMSVAAASNGFYGTTNGYAGTTAWSGGGTTWTWTSTGSGSTMTGTLTGAVSLGTSTARVKCAADSSNLTATIPAPTLSGRW